MELREDTEDEKVELNDFTDPAEGFIVFEVELVALEAVGPEMLELEILGGTMHSVLRKFSTEPDGQTHTPPLTTWFGTKHTHCPVVELTTKPMLH